MGLMDKVFGRDDDEKKKADFSNVQGGASSTAPRPAAPAAPAAGAAGSAGTAARTYTVKAGDSLSKIAQREYGEASEWKKIYEANRDIIKNPDLIHPGQTLKLP